MVTTSPLTNRSLSYFKSDPLGLPSFPTLDGQCVTQGSIVMDVPRFRKFLTLLATDAERLRQSRSAEGYLTVPPQGGHIQLFITKKDTGVRVTVCDITKHEECDSFQEIQVRTDGENLFHEHNLFRPGGFQLSQKVRFRGDSLISNSINVFPGDRNSDWYRTKLVNVADQMIIGGYSLVTNSSLEHIEAVSNTKALVLGPDSPSELKEVPVVSIHKQGEGFRLHLLLHPNNQSASTINLEAYTRLVTTATSSNIDTSLPLFLYSDNRYYPLRPE